MVSKITFLNVVLLFTVYAVHADWQGDLAEALGPSKRWNSAQVRNVIAHMRKQDHAQIQKFEHRVEAVEYHEKTAPSGLKGALTKVGDKLSEAADKSSLSTAQTEHREHERMARALEELERNRIFREEALAYIVNLYENEQKLVDREQALKALKSEYEQAGVGHKIKVAAKITGKEIEIAGAKAQVAYDKRELAGFLNRVLSEKQRVANLMHKYSAPSTNRA
jgi:predicted nucleic-acid-binding protein